MRKFLFLILLLAPSLCWAQFATTMDSSDVAGWQFTTFTDVDDTLLWNKSGTNLSPATAGDDVLLNTGETFSIADMTTGSVPFFGASGLLSQDNANLFWDNTNNRFGIGTATPSSITHIKGNIPGTVGSHPAGQLIIQNPTASVLSNVVITAYDSDVGGAPDQQLWYLGSSSGSNSNITFLNRRSALLALGTNNLTRLTILETGNIGIGTTAPPQKLSVAGNIATGDSTTGDTDVYHYFSTDASWTTEYLKWDDGNSRFELSDDLYVGGTVLSLDTLTKSFVIASIDDTFDFPFWQTKRAITIVAVSAVCTGGTNVVGALQEYNATGTAVDAAVDGDWTITTSEYTDASFTNAGIDAGDWLGWKTTSVSGSVTFFSITIEYTEE